MFSKDEWTQKEFLENKKILEEKGIEVILIDTILKPIDNIKTMTYNPFEMELLPENSVFVFYCDTGKTTKERLEYYKKKFPSHKCVSLRGGRAYFRPNYQLLDMK
jgi:peptidase E